MRKRTIVGWALWIVLILSVYSTRRDEPVKRELQPSETLSEEDEARLMAAREERRKQEAERRQAHWQALLDSAVDAPSLSVEFGSNPIRALRRYEGKPIVVSGKVVSIKEGFLGDGIINLIGKDAYSPVVASFSDADELLKLDIGSRIHIRCGELDSSFDRPFLSGCEIPLPPVLSDVDGSWQ